MEQIKSFTINRLTLSGFKCFEAEQTFHFGDYTSIYGHNGKGKSSLADAIAYAVTGVTFFGESRLDRLYHGGTAKAEVKVLMAFTDETGAQHELLRTRRNDRTDVFLDEKPVTQTILNTMFGERDVFLSILNPLYFIEVLEDKGRNLLERYLPALPQQQVMEQMDDHSRELLARHEILSVEGFLKRLREDIRELEKDITYQEGQRDLLASQEQQARDTMAGLRIKAEELGRQIASLEEKKNAGIDFSAVNDSLADLHARYEEMLRDGAEQADTAEVDALIRDTQARLDSRQKDEYRSSYRETITKLSTQVDTLKQQYAREAHILKGLQPGVKCPTCRQTVTEGNLDAVRREFQTSIGEIRRQGTELTAQLAQVQELEKKEQTVFEQFLSDDIAKLTAELQEHQQRRSAVLAGGETAREQAQKDREALYSRIQALDTLLRDGNLEFEEVEALAAAKTARKELESQMTLLQKQEPAAQSKAFDIEGIKSEIQEKKLLINAAARYVAKKNEMIFAALKMNRVSISLFDVVKGTGEVKDTFRFTYEGRPYKWLSLSEKIRAGLEISQLVSRLTGCRYPVFIDNGESVPVIDNIKPRGQIFMAHVVKGANLTVEPIYKQSGQNKAAA